MIIIPSFNLSAEAETVTARNDLKLALKRVEDLQQAINGELDSELDSLARYESNLNISLYIRRQNNNKWLFAINFTFEIVVMPTVIPVMS